jgi:hypothetical protein
VKQEPVQRGGQGNPRASSQMSSVTGLKPNEFDEQPRFCRGALGMWHWICSNGGSELISREAFSNIHDCEKDAMRHLKSLRAS